MIYIIFDFILQIIQSNIGIIEKTDANREDYFWQEWRDVLRAEFDGRLSGLSVKGYGIIPDKKAFIAIFLQIKGFFVPGADILAAAIKTIKEKNAFPLLKEYDAVAMMGHRIGMLENSSGIKHYLQDISPSLRPDGGLLFTSIDINQKPDLPNRITPVYPNLQFQQVNLIGPFFAMLRIKPDALKKQAVAANWRCEILYQQDENNYITRLNPCQSG
jgi:hypothetical protein